MAPDLISVDVRTIIEIAGTAGGAGLAWIQRAAHMELSRVTKIVDALPNTYVRKDDLKDSFDRLYRATERLERRLDNRVDED